MVIETWRPHMRRSVLALATLIVAALPVAAQAPKLSPLTKRFISVDAPVVALTHVKVIDGTGAPPMDDQTIIIERGKIAAIGKAGSVTVPPGAQVMELAGHTVLPGFVGL